MCMLLVAQRVYESISIVLDTHLAPENWPNCVVCIPTLNSSDVCHEDGLFDRLPTTRRAGLTDLQTLMVIDVDLEKRPGVECL